MQSARAVQQRVQWSEVHSAQCKHSLQCNAVHSAVAVKSAVECWYQMKVTHHPWLPCYTTDTLKDNSLQKSSSKLCQNMNHRQKKIVTYGKWKWHMTDDSHVKQPMQSKKIWLSNKIIKDECSSCIRHFRENSLELLSKSDTIWSEGFIHTSMTSPTDTKPLKMN